MVVHYLLAGFVAVSFCVCFALFTYCYTFLPAVSTRQNGQVRSLSGIMKNADFKPYFCFVMGCLGLSLFLATGMRSTEEKGTRFRRDFVFALSLGMYVCLIGVIKYDVAVTKSLHFSFVFAMIAFGYVFCNTALGHGSWNSVAFVSYNSFTSLFLLCALTNVYLKSQSFTDYYTLQSYLEIAWVLSLNFMLCVYSFEERTISDA
jgi:hypothetical protein